METALLAGIPPALVDRAIELKQQLLQQETSPSNDPDTKSENNVDIRSWLTEAQPKGGSSQNGASKKNGKPAFGTLEDVWPLFKDLAGGMYSEGGTNGGGAFIAIVRGSVPPPSTVNRAYVYIFQRTDGAFYVGEVSFRVSLSLIWVLI
jgi:hypothetical protein